MKDIDPPEGYRPHGPEVKDSLILKAAAMAADYKMFAEYHTRIGELDTALNLGSFVQGVQHFLLALVRAVTPGMRLRYIHVSRAGKMYINSHDTTPWTVPETHILTAWANQLTTVMANDFAHEPSATPDMTVDGSRFSIVPNDPRIAQVHEIYELVKDPGEGHVGRHAELSAPTQSFLFSVLINMIIASTTLPQGYVPASLGFKDGCIIGSIDKV